MRESRSYGSVGERGGNEPPYPEVPFANFDYTFVIRLMKIILNIY